MLRMRGLRYQMNKIIVTGATGYIGNRAARELSKENKIWCTVRQSSNVDILDDFPCKKIFVDEKMSMYEAFNKVNPDCVIHIGGVFAASHDSTNIQQLLESNIFFPSIVFDAAYAAGCRKFINTGSFWQNYGGEDYNPVNLYAATKEAAEDILKFYVRSKGCKALTLNIFDTYGFGDHRKKILNIIRDLADGDTIGITEGNQKMYLCYIDDLLSAYRISIGLLDSMGSGEYKKYSLRGETPNSLREIIETYISVSGKKIDIRYGEREYRHREIMDPTGWGEVLPGWKQKYDLKTGIRKYLSGE